MKNFWKEEWRNWPYKNTTWLVISLILFFWLLGFPVVENTLRAVGSLGLLGAFFSGALFVSIFTVAPAAVVILFIAESLNVWLVALAAGLGAMVGDYLIFRFLRDQVFEELAPLWQRSVVGSITGRLFSTPYFSWLIPIIGMIAIASPVPDEVGISLLSSTKIKTSAFLVITFLLNTAGILALVLAAQMRT